MKKLDELGAVVVRQRKHVVYELPGGERFVVAKTPSGGRGERNALAWLRRWELRRKSG